MPARGASKTDAEERKRKREEQAERRRAALRAARERAETLRSAPKKTAGQTYVTRRGTTGEREPRKTEDKPSHKPDFESVFPKRDDKPLFSKPDDRPTFAPPRTTGTPFDKPKEDTAPGIPGYRPRKVYEEGFDSGVMRPLGSIFEAGTPNVYSHFYDIASGNKSGSEGRYGLEALKAFTEDIIVTPEVVAGDWKSPWFAGGILSAPVPFLKFPAAAAKGGRAAIKAGSVAKGVEVGKEAYRTSTPVISAAKYGGRKAGKAVPEPVKKVVRKRREFTYKNPDGSEAFTQTVPESGTRTGRLFERAIDRARPQGRTNDKAWKEREYSRRFGENMTEAATGWVIKAAGKLSQEEWMALRLLGSKTDPEVMLKQAVDAAQGSTDVNGVGRAYHATKADRIDGAKEFIDVSTDGTLTLSDNASPALRKTYNEMVEELAVTPDLFRAVEVIGDESITEAILRRGVQGIHDPEFTNQAMAVIEQSQTRKEFIEVLQQRPGDAEHWEAIMPVYDALAVSWARKQGDAIMAGGYYEMLLGLRPVDELIARIPAHREAFEEGQKILFQANKHVEGITKADIVDIPDIDVGRVVNAVRRHKLPRSLQRRGALHQIVKRFDAFARESQEYRDWYRRHANAAVHVSEFTDTDIETVAQLFSIFSQNADPTSALGHTVKLLRQAKYGEPLEAGLYPNLQRPQYEAVLRGDPWEGMVGPKRDAFLHNILSYINPEKYPKGTRATIDSWMGKAATPTGANPINTTLYYDAIETMVKEIAQQYGWLPDELQAAVWVSIKKRGLVEADANRAAARGLKSSSTLDSVTPRAIDAGERGRDLYVEGQVFQGMDDIARGVEDTLGEAGGHTWNPNGSSFVVSDGYMVSYEGFERVVPAETFTDQVMADYFSEFADDIAKLEGAKVGAWKSGDEVYMDISEHVMDRNEALRKGVSRNQQSVYDGKTGDFINREQMLKESKESYEKFIGKLDEGPDPEEVKKSFDEFINEGPDPEEIKKRYPFGPPDNYTGAQGTDIGKFADDAGDIIGDRQALARDIGATLPPEDWPTWARNSLKKQDLLTEDGRYIGGDWEKTDPFFEAIKGDIIENETLMGPKEASAIDEALKEMGMDAKKLRNASVDEIEEAVEQSIAKGDWETARVSILLAMRHGKHAGDDLARLRKMAREIDKVYRETSIARSELDEFLEMAVRMDGSNIYDLPPEYLAGAAREKGPVKWYTLEEAKNLEADPDYVYHGTAWDTSIPVIEERILRANLAGRTGEGEAWVADNPRLAAAFGRSKDLEVEMAKGVPTREAGTQGVVIAIPRSNLPADLRPRNVNPYGMNNGVFGGQTYSTPSDIHFQKGEGFQAKGALVYGAGGSEIILARQGDPGTVIHEMFHYAERNGLIGENDARVLREAFGDDHEKKARAWEQWFKSGFGGSKEIPQELREAGRKLGHYYRGGEQVSDEVAEVFAKMIRYDPVSTYGAVHNLAAKYGLMTLDAINDIQRFLVLYANPLQYGFQNLVGNLLMNLIQQGVFLPRNLYRAARISSELSGAELARLDAMGGMGVSKTLFQGQPSSNALSEFLNFKVGDFFNRAVDTLPRRAAILHEAHKAGYKNTDDLKRLLNDMSEEGLEASETVARRGRAAIVDFDRMTPFERNYVSRAIWFYPWVRGATSYTGHWMKEHPLQAIGLTAMIAHADSYANERMGERPDYARWAYPISTSTLGLGIPGTDLNVGIDDIIGKHEWTNGDDIVYTMNIRQLLTHTTPADTAMAARGFMTGNHRMPALVEQTTPALYATGSALFGKDPFTKEDVSQDIFSAGRALTRNIPLLERGKKIGMSEEDRAKKNENAVYPRSRTEEMTRGFGGFAPTPYNIQAGREAAVRDVGGSAEKLDLWISRANKALGKDPPPHIIEQFEIHEKIEEKRREFDTEIDKVVQIAEVLEEYGKVGEGYAENMKNLPSEQVAEEMLEFLRPLAYSQYLEYQRLIDEREKLQERREEAEDRAR